MTAALFKKSAKLAAIALCVSLFLAVSPASASSVNTTATPGALLDTSGLTGSDPLTFPGTPLTDYGWTLLFVSTLTPADPGFFNLGSVPGTFLVTGNTMFNFTGDAQYLIAVFSTAVQTGSSAQVAIPQVAPEPGTWWLVASLFVVVGFYRGFRKSGPPASRMPASSLASSR